MRYLLNSLIGGLTLLYPAAVYFGLQYLEPRMIALFLSLMLLLRLLLAEARTRLFLVACLAYAAIAAWSNQVLALRFYPVMVNASLLLIFTASLIYPPSLIERLARLQKPELPQAGVLYTRRVTQIWCLFFLLNGSLALATALWSSFEIWSLYNGLIAYLLIGLLLGGEYLVRQRVQV